MLISRSARIAGPAAQPLQVDAAADRFFRGKPEFSPDDKQDE